MLKISVIGLAVAAAAWMPVNVPDAYPPGIDSSWTAGVTFDDLSPEQREWSWKGRVEPGDFIEIKGVNGEIHAERASGNEVEVEAELRGRRSDPNEVEIQVVEHADGVTICAVYPSKNADRPNECRPGSKGHNNVKDNDVSVDFTVRVPAGVGFIGRTVNGDVDALGIDGDVQAHTVNGGIDISSNGLAEATTVNGSITASMDRANWDGTLSFTTVNGSVTLEMPDDLNCDLSVSTVNGHLDFDFPLTVEGRFSPRHVKGTIGQGGRSLVIKTVNGSVQLRRS